MKKQALVNGRLLTCLLLACNYPLSTGTLKSDEGSDILQKARLPDPVALERPGGRSTRPSRVESSPPRALPGDRHRQRVVCVCREPATCNNDTLIGFREHTP
jgi:hypothetical protein